MSLKEISHHIYGIKESVVREDRPHFFVKELELYVNYFKEKIEDSALDFNKKNEKYLQRFLDNIIEGIEYYTALFDEIKSSFYKSKDVILEGLKKQKLLLDEVSEKLDFLKKGLD